MTHLNANIRKAILTEKQLINLLAYNNMVHSQTIKNWSINNSPMLTTADNLKTISEHFNQPQADILTYE